MTRIRELERLEFGEKRGCPVAAMLLDGSIGDALRLHDLCALIPDVLKARFERVIRTRPAEAFGPRAPERAARLAELLREIAQVRDQHTPRG